MEWMKDPAWWALGVAIIGTTANGIWNWLNWSTNRPPAYAVTAEYRKTGLEEGIFVLRNLGRKPLSGLILEEIAPLPPPAATTLRLLGESPADLHPGESLSFQAKVEFPTPTGQWKLGVPQKILVRVDQLRDPLVLELSAET